LLHFCARKVLSHGGCYFFKLLSPEGSAAGVVKSLEDGLQSGLIVRITPRQKPKDLHESAEVELPRHTSGIRNGQDLPGLGVPVESLHRVDQLIDLDLAAIGVVERVEYLLQLGHCFHWQVIFHVFGGIEG
jgi:hypothetical protein